LSVSPSAATPLVSNAYITVKSVYGVEVQPHVKSSFTFFQQTPPIPDDRAIHIAAGIVHQKPDGFPASANDLGSIIALAATYAPKIIGWLSNAFSANKEKAVVKEAVKEEVDETIRQYPPARMPAGVVSRIPMPRASLLPRVAQTSRSIGKLTRGFNRFGFRQPPQQQLQPITLNATRRNLRRRRRRVANFAAQPQGVAAQPFQMTTIQPNMPRRSGIPLPQRTGRLRAALGNNLNSAGFLD